MKVSAAALALGATLALAGCGSSTTLPAPVESAYDGPLHVAKGDAVHPSAGAAGNVVRCRTWGHGTHVAQRVYSEGATASTPGGALEVARGEGGYDGILRGWTPVKREGSRVLYVIEVEGVVKQAVVVHDGPATKGAGGDGWYVESFARCDDSELGPAYARSIGLELWTQRDGRIAPSQRIASYTGHHACDSEQSTFLLLGRSTYVRRPDPGFRQLLVGPYRAHAALPADAVDTGYRRAGRHLWLSADRRHAFAGSRTDVEDWPGAKSRIGCG